MKCINLFKHFAIIVAAIGSLVLLCSYTPSNTTINDDNEDLELLQMITKEMQSKLPIDTGDGTSLSEVYVTNTHLVMEYICPKNMVELLRLGMDNYSKAEFIKDCQFLNICVDAGVGVRLIFTNESYSNQVRIEYSVDELKYNLK